MATIAVQNVVKTGLEPTYEAANGGGDEFANPDGNRMYVLINGGSEIVATFITQATKDELAVADRDVTIPAGESRWVTDLDPNVYNDTDDMVQVTYDGVSSLTVGVFMLNGV